MKKEMNNDVLIKIKKINERVVKIKGEIDSLDFRKDIGIIDAKLYRMKRKTNLYELSLLDEEVDKLRNEMEIRKMLSEINISTLIGSINLN
mgnify:FL=1